MPGGSGCHAGERGGDLRDCPGLRQLALEADVADLSRPQEADETTADIGRKGTGLGIDVHAPGGSDQNTLIGEPLHHQLEVVGFHLSQERAERGRREGPDRPATRLKQLFPSAVRQGLRRRTRHGPTSPRRAPSPSS